MRYRDQLEKCRRKFRMSKTAKLWLQYSRMVDLLWHFIRGERTGNWMLHIHSMYKMPPYFAASGHNLYQEISAFVSTKNDTSARWHPEVYRHFMADHHVCRRSAGSWAGISPDLTFEQCLMWSVKSTGGLTRGRGMSEIQRLVWVLCT